MSSTYVSFEVWSNGRLAANRFALLARELQRLPGKLREVARLWQEARDQYGEEFPEWSYGDSKVPYFVRRSLRDGNLAGLVVKVQLTTSGFDDGRKSGEEVGLSAPALVTCMTSTAKSADWMPSSATSPSAWTGRKGNTIDGWHF